MSIALSGCVIIEEKHNISAIVESVRNVVIHQLPIQQRR